MVLNVEIKIFPAKDFQKYIKIVTKHRRIHSIYKNFIYFNHLEIFPEYNDNDGYYIVVFDKEYNNKIIGVMKYREINIDGSVHYGNENCIFYKVITFINVHSNYQKQGLMKSLLLYFNKQCVNKGDIITSTMPSEIGRKISINKRIGNIIHNGFYFNDEDEILKYYRYLYVQEPKKKLNNKKIRFVFKKIFPFK